MNLISPYQNEQKPWKEIIKGKHIIFDSNSIIYLLKYEAIEIFKEFDVCDTVKCFIHPIYAEIANTNNPVERVTRLALLQENNFRELPMYEKHYLLARVP